MAITTITVANLTDIHGTSLTPPNGPIASANGTTFGNIVVGTNLTLTGTYPNQTLNGAAIPTVPNGSIISGNGTVFGTIAVGANLSLTGSFPTQTLSASGGGGSAGITLNNQSTSGYTVVAADLGKWIEIGAFTYTLPAANTFAAHFQTLFINIGSGDASLVANSPSTFLGSGGGATTLILPTGSWVQCVSDGTNWVTIA